MAGRGRPTNSLTHEQMSSMGLVGKDMSQAITAPPPVFPALMSKPVPLETGAARDYKILWKEDFISFLKDSPYFTHPSSENESKILRYSDKYVQVLTKKRDNSNKEINWNHLPCELRPNWKRKTNVSCTAAKKTKLHKNINVEEKLKVLEEKELGTSTKDQSEAANRKVDSDAEDDEEFVEDEQDEEMDQDNDYGNNYFDNGDEEEDDNLDDGPIY